MRKIEQEMVDAINGRENWAKGNTQVRCDVLFRVAEVFLHGHHLATVAEDGEVVTNIATLSKWPTATTKSRLRALGVNVRTHQSVTYLFGQPIQ